VVVAPDGNTTADNIVEDGTAANSHLDLQSITLAANTTTTLSCWIKRASGTRNVQLALFVGANQYQAKFDLSNGTVNGSSASGDGSITGASVRAYPNGWYRCIVTGIHSATVANPIIAISLCDASFATTYNGDSTSSISLWGAQLEAGSFATSYIPTTTASVVRAADVATYPSAGNVVVGQGTIYAKVTAFDVSGIRYVASVSDGTLNNCVNLLTSTVARMQTISGGVTQADMTVSGAAANVEQREAATWGTNISNVFRNGTPGVLDITVTVPVSFSTINLTCNGAGVQALAAGTVRDIRIWQRVLSDSQIASIR
jgi:hypothetical protein